MVNPPNRAVAMVETTPSEREHNNAGPRLDPPQAGFATTLEEINGDG